MSAVSSLLSFQSPVDAFCKMSKLLLKLCYLWYSTFDMPAWPYFLSIHFLKVGSLIKRFLAPIVSYLSLLTQSRGISLEYKIDQLWTVTCSIMFMVNIYQVIVNVFSYTKKIALHSLQFPAYSACRWPYSTKGLAMWIKIFDIEYILWRTLTTKSMLDIVIMLKITVKKMCQ